MFENDHRRPPLRRAILVFFLGFEFIWLSAFCRVIAKFVLVPTKVELSMWFWTVILVARSALTVVPWTWTQSRVYQLVDFFTMNVDFCLQPINVQFVGSYFIFWNGGYGRKIVSRVCDLANLIGHYRLLLLLWRTVPLSALTTARGSHSRTEEL